MILTTTAAADPVMVLRAEASLAVAEAAIGQITITANQDALTIPICLNGQKAYLAEN